MNPALNSIFDVVLHHGLHPAWAMVGVSVVTAIVMLVVYRWTSNQEGLRRAKARVIGEVLAIRLFDDDPWTTMRCLGGVLRANVTYLRYTLIPLLVGIGPVVLIIIQLDSRFSHEPLVPGESATVGLVLDPEAYDLHSQVALRVPDGMTVETPPLRIPALQEIDWRVRVHRDGEYDLEFDVGQETVTKTVRVGEGLWRLSGARAAGGWLNAIFYPSEPLLPDALGIVRVTLDYPLRSFRIIGVEVHWLLAFFLLSLGFAFALKKPLGVEV